MKIGSLWQRTLLLAVMLVCSAAHAGQYKVTFSGYVSDVNCHNLLVGLGDSVTGTVSIDSDAPNWYGDDPDWGAYEGSFSLAYGKVAFSSLMALYVDVRGDELFGVARFPIDEAAMIYSDFRFWVNLKDVASTSLLTAVNTMESQGLAMLLTFDRDTEVQSYVRDVRITLSPVPEASISTLTLAGIACLLCLFSSGKKAFVA